MKKRLIKYIISDLKHFLFNINFKVRFNDKF